MTLVVDASVGLKWFIEEVHQSRARGLLGGADLLIAPQHFRIELISAVRKKVRTGDVPPNFVPELLAGITNAPVRELPTRPLLAPAMDIALRFNRSIYDSLYVALALQEGCQLVTADRRLHDALAPSFPGTMLWIEDVGSSSAG